MTEYERGVEAGRESMRAERDHWSIKYGRAVDKCNDLESTGRTIKLDLEAERERSKKLYAMLEKCRGRMVRTVHWPEYLETVTEYEEAMR